eukprot:1005673-Rhodomonas_salina.2
MLLCAIDVSCKVGSIFNASFTERLRRTCAVLRVANAKGHARSRSSVLLSVGNSPLSPGLGLHSSMSGRHGHRTWCGRRRTGTTEMTAASSPYPHPTSRLLTPQQGSCHREVDAAYLSQIHDVVHTAANRSVCVL